MKSKKPSRKDMLSLCADIYPDDGIDPRKFFKSGSHKDYTRKDRQLCGQIARALSLALAQECDDIVCDLCVVSVEPAPDSSRLLITVGQQSKSLYPPHEILVHLQKIAGKLRYEVATAINRKKAPNLTFCFTNLVVEEKR